MSLPSKHQWVIVYSTISLPEAHIVAGRLEHEGVPTLIHQAIGGSAMGISIGKLGEITVLVHPDNYNFALAILDEDDSDYQLPETTDDIYIIDDE